MPIVVACQCGARFAAQDHLAGKSVRCPKCQKPLTIPAPAAAAAPQATSVGSILDEVGVGAVQGMRCPQCGADVPSGAVICVKCGYDSRKGKAIRVEGDKAAAKRHEKVVEKQRVSAEKQAAKVNAAMRDTVAGSATDLGGVPEATTAIVRFPVESFTRLKTIGGTKEAYGFAISGALLVGVMWAVFYTGWFFLVPLVATIGNPEAKDKISESFETALPLYGYILAYCAGRYLIGLFAWLAVLAPAMAAGAHLIIRFVGNSKVGYLATLRVFVYMIGVAYVVSSLPCTIIFTPFIYFIHTTIALSVHHRVPAGVAILAHFVALIFMFITAFAFAMLLGVMGISYIEFLQWNASPETPALAPAPPALPPM